MKVYVLMDNTKEEGSCFEAEHGFSLWIDADGRGILYDTGVSEKTFENAARLGIDIASAECAVISHGHYDHAGGLRYFLEHNAAAGVCLHPLCWGKQLSNTTGTLRYIGMETALAAEFAERFVTFDRSFSKDGLEFIVPPRNKKYSCPAGNGALFSEIDGVTVPDQFRHETVFAVKDKGELVVFSGCSHQGIGNVMAAVAERFPGVPVKAAFGVFHMSSPATGALTEKESAVADTAKLLLSFSGCVYYTGHCTGAGAYSLMRGIMGERIRLLRAGEAIEI